MAATPKRGTVTRDLHDAWNAGTVKGDTVYAFWGCTYGCISPGGQAVSKEPGKGPFFEVPLDAVRWEG